jgi:hypothetical protein
MIKLVDNYQKALDAIYEHVGFKEDWVICPLDDCTEMYWDTWDKIVRYAKSIEEYKSESGDYYQDDIYTQRSYDKWVYEGEDFTMIFCNPGVDGMKWFRLFDNNKRMNAQYQRKRKLNQRKRKLNQIKKLF